MCRKERAQKKNNEGKGKKEKKLEQEKNEPTITEAQCETSSAIFILSKSGWG